MLARPAIGVSDVLSLTTSRTRTRARADAIVLALGLTSAAGEAFAVLDFAGRRAAAVVAFRAEREFAPRIVGLAETLEVGLVVASPEMKLGLSRTRSCAWCCQRGHEPGARRWRAWRWATCSPWPTRRRRRWAAR